MAQAYGGRKAPESGAAKAVYDTLELSVDQIVELLQPDPREGGKGYAPSGRWVKLEQADLDQCFAAASKAGLGAPSKNWGAQGAQAQGTDKYYSVKLTFNNGRFEPDAAGTQAIAKLAQALGHNDLLGRRFMVEGHADAATGTAAQNREVSCLRAVRIREMLIKNHGIAAQSLLPVGYGVDKPLPNIDPKDASNRRVAFRLLPLNGQ